MNGFASIGAKYFIGAGVVGSLLLTQGCIATRDWVKEQMDPLDGRVSQTESRISKTEGDISSLGGRMSGVEGNWASSKGDWADRRQGGKSA